MTCRATELMHDPHDPHPNLVVAHMYGGCLFWIQISIFKIKYFSHTMSVFYFVFTAEFYATR
jgi:hypothetical protein